MYGTGGSKLVFDPADPVGHNFDDGPFLNVTVLKREEYVVQHDAQLAVV